MGKSGVKYFNMVELVVVMAVLGILSSLLMVSLGKARAEGKRTLCKNNQRHIHIGLVLFQGSNDGRLWHKKRSWVQTGKYGPGAIPEVLGFEPAQYNVDKNEVFFCPEIIEQDRVGEILTVRYGINYLDIWGNTGFDHIPDKPDLNWVKEPENFVMWADSHWEKVAIDWVDFKKLKGRHLGDANAVALDGSVQIIKGDRLSYAASVEADKGLRYSHNRKRSGF